MLRPVFIASFTDVSLTFIEISLEAINQSYSITADAASM